MARDALRTSPDNMVAGRALFRLRVLLGEAQNRNLLSQAEFAELLGQELPWKPGQSEISRWQRGRAILPFPVSVAASRVLGKHLRRAVTVEEFLRLGDRNLIDAYFPAAA